MPRAARVGWQPASPYRGRTHAHSVDIDGAMAAVPDGGRIDHEKNGGPRVRNAWHDRADGSRTDGRKAYRLFACNREWCTARRAVGTRLRAPGRAPATRRRHNYRA